MEPLKLLLSLVAISCVGLPKTFAGPEYTVADENGAKCPDGTIPVHRRCYTFHTRITNWKKASDECKNSGGELSSIQSMNEKSHMERYLNTNFPDTKWWVNLVKKENQWWWGDNSTVDEKTTPWKVAGAKNRPFLCGLIMFTNDIMLSNAKCRRKNGFLCEFKKLKVTTQPPTREQTTAADSTPSATEILTTAKNQTSLKSTTPSITMSEVILKEYSLATSEQPTQIVDSGHDLTPFTFPPKTKPSTRIVTIKAGNATPMSLTPPIKPKETVSPKTVEKTTIESAQSTKHREGFNVKTPHATRSTRSTPFASSISFISTSMFDESSMDFDTDTDDVTSFSGFPRQTTPVWKSTPSAGVSNVFTRLTSPLVPFTSDANDDEGEDLNVDEIIYGTDDDRSDSMEKPKTRIGHPMTSLLPRYPSTKPTTLKPRHFARPNRRYWLEAQKEFEGCYIPGGRVTARRTVLAAQRLYKDDADSCPQVTISRLTFPETEAGQTAVVKCRRGSGFATLDCGEDTVCWQDQPDLSGCASPRFKALLKRIKEKQIETMVNPEVEDSTIEGSVNVTSELVTITETDDISMEDILATSEVLAAVTHTTEDTKDKVKNKKAVIKIVGNVIKTGNNLLSKKKKKVWKKMAKEEKIRSASSLMVAMESATMSLALKIDEPTVIKQVEVNIEMEIQILDVAKLEEEQQKEIVYDSDQSDNSFSIPVENLKTVSDGKLDKVVFITHYSIAQLLEGQNDDEQENVDLGGEKDTISNAPGKKDPTVNKEDETVKKESGQVNEDGDDDEEEDESPQIASYIVSASIGGREGHTVKLPKPVCFTMKHVLDVLPEYKTLCSFWDASQGSGQAFWSQDGCSVKKTNRSHTTCECDHLTSFAILIDVHGFGDQVSTIHQSYLRIITIIGCVISCTCLIVSWLTFQFCTALQGERNSIHKNLAACLLVSELLFVAGVTQTQHKIACSVVAVFLHFFFLSAFTWMFLEGLHIIFMLVQVFDASRSRLPFYYITGYGFPAVVVGISCAIYFPGYGTESFCWLTNDRHFIWSFAGPVALILLVNAVFLSYAMTTVCRHSDYVFNAKDRSAGSPIRSWIQGALALEVLLGLTWMFGYFLLNASTLPLAYAFTILNSLQGLFIFVFHCLLNKKAQKEYSRVMRMPLRRRSSALTHSTFGKRTNGSTKTSHELANSNSNSRKLSLSYKHANGNGTNDNQNTDHQSSNGTNGTALTSINNSGEKDIV